MYNLRKVKIFFQKLDAGLSCIQPEELYTFRNLITESEKDLILNF